MFAGNLATPLIGCKLTGNEFWIEMDEVDSWRFRVLQWWESLAMVPAGNEAQKSFVFKPFHKINSSLPVKRKFQITNLYKS